MAIQVFLFWTFLLVAGGVSRAEIDIDSVDVDESVFAPGVRDVHRYVKEYREVKKYDLPPEEKVIELLHTVDFTKSGNNKFSKLGVLLDKLYSLSHGGVAFEDIQAVIPEGAELSQALIGLHKLKFEKRDQIKEKKSKKQVSAKPKNKRDPNMFMMELMGYVISGKMDLQFVDKVLNFLRDEPGFALSKAVDFASNFGFISKSSSKAITENLVPIFQSEAAGDYVNSFYNTTMAFFRSPSGERFIAGFPKIMKNPTAEQSLKFLKKEIEWNTELFFDSMANSDYKDSVLRTLSSYISKAIAQGESLLSSPSERGLLLLNGLFLSQGIPAYDNSRPIHSLGLAINKVIKLFTTFRFDVSPYIGTLEEMFEEVRDSSQWKLFFSLDEVQRLTSIQRFIDDELSEPINDLWMMHSFMAQNDKWNCAQRFICLEVERTKKSGREVQQVGTSVLSMGLAWIWNEGGFDGEFWKLYEAVWNGISLECESKYPPQSFQDCVNLPGQEEKGSSKKMELNFDKVEL